MDNRAVAMEEGYGAYPADGAGKEDQPVSPPPYAPDLSSVPVNDTSVPPPPSYESIFGKVKRAKQESNSNTDFGKQCWGMFMSSTGCLIITAFLNAVPIAMIAIGAIYLGQCRAQRMIPIYLVVAGVFHIVQFILSTSRRQKKKDLPDDEKGKPWPVESVVNTFLVIWFISGNVWIFGLYGKFDSVTTTAANYCHPTVYYFAFWVTLSVYILAGLFIFSCCCICACACLAGKKK